MKLNAKHAIVVLVVIAPEYGAAQSACFCLKHPVQPDIVRYGCESRIKPNGVTERVTCQKKSLVGREVLADAASSSRIPDGEGACNPCFAKAGDRKPNRPRGDDDASPQ